MTKTRKFLFAMFAAAAITGGYLAGTSLSYAGPGNNGGYPGPGNGASYGK